MSALLEGKSFNAIGRAIPRKEDARLLTGQGRFSDDFELPEQVYATMVRSVYPHARIRDVDVATAASMPGVMAVYTGRNCRDEGLGVIPHHPVPATRTDLKLRAPDGSDIFLIC